MLPSILRSTISPSFVERLTPAAESVAQAHHELRWMVQELNRRIGTPAWDSTNHDAELEKMVGRREKGEPLQYVLGTSSPILLCPRSHLGDLCSPTPSLAVGNQPFGPLLLTVRPPTLIPRPETEEWTLRLASLLPSAKPLRILDLCTGSGCIPLALLHALPQSQGVGVDLSSRALGLAEENAQLHGLNDRFRTVAGDLFAEGWAPRWVHQHGRVDVVTSNPPYIPAPEMRTLEKGVRDWEDERALLGDVSKRTSVGPTLLKRVNHRKFS